MNFLPKVSLASQDISKEDPTITVLIVHVELFEQSIIK